MRSHVPGSEEPLFGTLSTSIPGTTRHDEGETTALEYVVVGNLVNALRSLNTLVHAAGDQEHPPIDKQHLAELVHTELSPFTRDDAWNFMNLFQKVVENHNKPKTS